MFYLVGQTLKFVCVEMVVIPQDVVVAGTTGALQKKKTLSNLNQYTVNH